MTGSTHTYTAVLIGSPDQTLRLKEDAAGKVTLDARSAPHVTATLNLKPQSQAILDALDPRLNPRVRLTAAAVFPTFSQSRVFNLGVRKRPVKQKDGSVALDLASDEALLSDYAPLADVNYTSHTDLATLCQAVILAATGASVTVGGSTANITPLWDATNLLLNPSLEVDAANWGAGTGASALTRVALSVGVGSWGLRWTTAAGESSVYPHSGTTQTRATPGKVHTAGIRIQSVVARSARLVMRFYDTSSGLLAEYSSPYINTVTGGSQAYVVQGLAPSLASYVFVFIQTLGNAAGQFHFADGAYLVVSEFDTGYFDGATADTAQYDYAWTGTAHASASTRRALLAAPVPDALVHDAGQSALSFLAPLAQAAGLRLVCDESRAWTLRDKNYSAAGALNIRFAVNLTDGEDTIDRDDGEWFDALVKVYLWPDVYGIAQRKIDSYGLPGYTRCRLIEERTAYPGPGFAQYAVDRAKGRGRLVTASSVADWIAAAEQPITVVLDGAPTQVGKTDRVEFDLGNDEMTTTTRTTDTPVGAIDLLAGTIDALAGTIDAL